MRGKLLMKCGRIFYGLEACILDVDFHNGHHCHHFHNRIVNFLLISIINAKSKMRFFVQKCLKISKIINNIKFILNCTLHWIDVNDVFPSPIFSFVFLGGGVCDSVILHHHGREFLSSFYDPLTHHRVALRFLIFPRFEGILVIAQGRKDAGKHKVW